MKKIIFAVFILLGFVSFAFASPFLVADPYTGADYFVITGVPLDGSSVSPDTTYAFKFDLVNLPPGTYTVKAKACSNLWGCTDESAPFVFTRPALGIPAGIKLSK